VKKINRCRVCGSNALTPVFSADPRGFGHGAARRGLLSSKKSGTVDFVLCDSSKDGHACGLFQSAYVSDPAKLQPATANDQFPAATGQFRANRSHLRSIATESLELISGRDCAALDIGCNDGTLLSFYPRWVERFGVDPSDAVDHVGEWAWTAKAAFPSIDLDNAFNEKKFDIITAVSILEEVEEPRPFFARIKSLLTDDGVLALETRYAPMTLTRTGADVFAGGITAIYSLGVIERLLRDCGLKAFRGAMTDKEGGSVRLFITHADVEEYDFDPWYERLARLWDEENALALRAVQPYQAFERRVEGAKEAFESMIAAIARSGGTAHILGADARSAMLYAWAGEGGACIEAAVGYIHGGPNRAAERLVPGGPPVISQTDCRAAQPDYLIAPAPLKRELLEQWREPILQGAKMVFATPEPHVVHAGNYASELGKVLSVSDGGGGIETLRAILGAAGGPRLISDSGERASTG